MAMVIYDNGGKTADRYTVFPWAHSKALTERRTYLGMAEGGRGFSQWGELPADCPRGRHLGKIVKFEDLDKASQDHINARLAEGQDKPAQVVPAVETPQVRPQEPANPISKAVIQNADYARRLMVELAALRVRHGFKYTGGDVCQWSTERRLRPQVAKRIARLEGLIQVATQGWQESRFGRLMNVCYSSRSHHYSLAKLYKQGKYGHNELGS